MSDYYNVTGWLNKLFQLILIGSSLVQARVRVIMSAEITC